MRITGTYPLDGIKYFKPDGAMLNVKCPHCGAELGGGMADGMIEYPETNTTVELECDCGNTIVVTLQIELQYKIEVVSVSEDGELEAP